MLNTPAPKRAATKKRTATKDRIRASLSPKAVLRRDPVTDPETGNVYRSKREMVGAQRQRHTQMLTDFAAMVRDQTLGQDPWERLPVESDLQYDRFRQYLRQLPERKGQSKRSTTRLAVLLGLAHSTTAALADRYSWKLRADCWDRAIEQQEADAFIEEKRIAVRRQARLGMRLQDLALIGAENMILTNGADLTPGDVGRLADVGVKIERLAHDKSTSNDARQTETRLVWDGPAPKWASHSEEVVVQDQVEDGPLRTKVSRLESGASGSGSDDDEPSEAAKVVARIMGRP